jgi:hypothetical protein
VAVSHIQIDGLLGAGLDTEAAAGAGVHIDEPGIRDGAEARWAVDGLGRGQGAFVDVGPGLGTDAGAEAAAVAEVRVDEAGLVGDGGGEGAGLAGEVGEVGVG